MTDENPAGGPPVSRRPRLLPALLVLLLGAAFAAGAGGAEEGVFYKGWTVTDLRIEGAPRGMDAEIRRGLALAPVSGVLRTKRALFYPSVLEGDIARMRLYLARRGYPEAAIDVRFEPEPDRRSVRLVLVLDPGDPVRVRSFFIEGEAPEGEAAAERLRREWEGSVFREDRLAEAVEDLKAVHLDSGYAWAEVSPEIEPVAGDGVSVRLVARPGARCVFRKTIVEGPPDDLAGLARKTADIEPGRRFSPEVLDHARRNLRLLDLFRQIRVEPVDAGDGTVDVRLRLLTRKLRSVEFGIGYWTDDLLRGHARWEHHSLFSRGRGFGVQGAASRFRQSVGLSTWWPAWIGPQVRGELGGDLEWEREESYDLDSRSVEIGARYRPSFTTTVRAGLALSDVNVDVKSDDEDVFVEGDGLLTTLSLLGHRDSSDDRLFPTNGSVTWARGEWAPSGFLSGSHFILGEASGTVYLGLTDRLVIAARIGGGAAKPIGGSMDLLPNKRFYGGGASSMRGFQRRHLGPQDSDGGPVGGEAKLEGAVEIRFPLFWRFQGAAFTDVGQVWSRAREVRPEDLEAAVGPSLMILTPVGAVRGDWGRRLTDRQKNEPKNVFHLSIGHPF